MYDFQKLARGHPEVQYELSLRADGEPFTKCEITVIGNIPTNLKFTIMRNLRIINEDDECRMLELADALVGYGTMIKQIVMGETVT